MNRIKTIAALTFLMVLLTTRISAQYTQTVRGQVLDQVLQKPLEGATVTIDGHNESSVTDDGGNFRLNNVPVGIRRVSASYVGYKEVYFDHVVVNSGKEVVLTVGMELDIDMQQEVEVVVKSKKNRPINDMSVVSARAFTVEETQKYAAAVNDPLRMATSFAGVVSADDGNNDIVIRGNSPAGLLWRMEGVDIPNPNHFSLAGSSGGGISILSAQLLDNSDFVTGAFAAEYGNALSGVFDLRLRKGNNEKREYTVQAGLLGLNVAAEGPLMPFYKGSYLVNYRYSTLQLLSKLGLNTGAGGISNFQDLSFNIYLPTARFGDFTVFGFGGLSSSDQEIIDSTKWESEGDRYGGIFKSNTGALGITHRIAIGSSTYLRSSAALSYTGNSENTLYMEDNGHPLNTYQNDYSTKKLILSTVMNHQFGPQLVLRSGLTANLIGFDFYQKSRENRGHPVLERINTKDATQTVQGFAQAQYRATAKLSVNGGFHYLQLLLNNSRALEPRASVKYAFDKKNTVSLGFGRHSQIQALGVYFAKVNTEDGQTFTPNRNLAFTRANHYVFSYGHAFNSDLRVKTEIYYQRLTNVPVSVYDSLSFSTLNIRGDYVTDRLINKGSGRNYGVDISIEKHLYNNLYFLFNNSIYEAKYTAADGVERNTRFNGHYVSNFTGGKEFFLADNKRVFGVHLKVIYAGGFRTTPIDLAESAQKGYTVFNEQAAFSEQLPDYFRTDLRVSMKWNKKGLTSTLSLDVQNLTNRQNVYNHYFDPYKGEVVTNFQTGLIPVLNYKVEF